MLIFKGRARDCLPYAEFPPERKVRLRARSVAHSLHFTKKPHGSSCVLLSALFIHDGMLHPARLGYRLVLLGILATAQTITQSHAIPLAICGEKLPFAQACRADNSTPATNICARLRSHRLRYGFLLPHAHAYLHATQKSCTV